MANISLLKDALFLKLLNSEKIKTYYVKILILDKDELPLRPIEGRVSAGSISLSGNSAVRRAGSLTFLAEEEKNDLTDIDNLLSMNKKVKILIGIENTLDTIHDKIIWFNQGIFVICNPSLSHGIGGVNISISFKDKMCLLNGECGGNLPASVTFHEYDQIIGYDDNDGKGYSNYPWNPNNYTVYKIKGEYMMWDATDGWSESSMDVVGSIKSVPQLIFDIIQTLVCNYGNEAIARIVINDIERQIRNIVRYTGVDTLFYNNKNNMYTLDEENILADPENWVGFGYNEDCGYIYTDLVYPGQLISSIGDNVCSVLDKITSVLGNYEYFYDIEGNFIFQEKKNYLNTTYEPTQKLDENGFLISAENYYVDFSNASSSVYTFEEGSDLISAYANTPSYSNIKNDFHIWGKNEDGLAIHYHLVIKEKPTVFSKWQVIHTVDKDGFETGQIELVSWSEEVVDSNGNTSTVIKTVKPILNTNTKVYDYIPNDWRVEIYMRGLQKKALEQRPDIYEQEILDFMDSIYNFAKQEWKVDIVNHPNDLLYWIDYINPAELVDISVDSIGTKMYSEQKDKIIKLYNTELPNVLIINSDATAISQASIIKRCESEGQAYSRVSSNVYKNLSLGTLGYSAEEVAREALYKYTIFTAGISLTSIPIYYLDTNTRITVHDRAAGIDGDYVINSINLPLDAKNNMSISASTALVRV